MEKLITRMGNSIVEKIDEESVKTFYRTVVLIFINNIAIGAILWSLKLD